MPGSGSTDNGAEAPADATAFAASAGQAEMARLLASAAAAGYDPVAADIGPEHNDEVPAAALRTTLPVRDGRGAPPNNPEHTQWLKDMYQNLKGMELSPQDLQLACNLPLQPVEQPTTPFSNGQGRQDEADRVAGYDAHPPSEHD